MPPTGRCCCVLGQPAAFDQRLDNLVMLDLEPNAHKPALLPRTTPALTLSRVVTRARHRRGRRHETQGVRPRLENVGG